MIDRNKANQKKKKEIREATKKDQAERQASMKTTAKKPKPKKKRKSSPDKCIVVDQSQSVKADAPEDIPEDAADVAAADDGLVPVAIADDFDAAAGVV